MKSADFLDALRVKFRCSSDRKLARQIGWPREEISAYRTGRREFSERKCVAVAQLLNIAPAYVMVEIRAERADCTETREAWQGLIDMLKGVRTHAAAVLLGLALLGGALPEATAAAVERGAEYTLYALGRARRWLARVLGALRRSDDCRHARRRDLGRGYWRCLDCGVRGIYPVRPRCDGGRRLLLLTGET